MSFDIIDSDNHLYEPDDCFTRYIDPSFRDRALQVREVDARRKWYFGDQPVVFTPDALDATLEPGALQAFFRGEDPSKASLEFIETDQAAFRNPKARVERLDEQGIQAAVVYHGVGLIADHELRHDPVALQANTFAYNRWIEDDWGWSYLERLFVPAVLTQRGPIEPILAELDRVLEAGARLILLRPGPIDGMSPADRHFDPFWARINEARVPVVYHVSQAGYTHFFANEWGENPDVDDQSMGPFIIFTSFRARPMQDTILNLSLRNLFGRFPNLRVMSVENGVEWVRPMLKIDRIIGAHIRTRGGELDRSGDFITRSLKDTLRDHFWACPFPEEDPTEVLRVLGEGHVLFGSDYPHPEGLADPREYLDQYDLSTEQRRKLMHDNAAELLGIA